MIDQIHIDLPTNARGEQPFLRCRVAGPVGAPLLLFLHGFPEGPFIWDDVITHFSSTHRCVAPALRGYPGSYTPADVKAYRAHEVVADLLALIRLQSPTPDTPAAAVIGHDWGGAIAWTLASMAPQSLQRLLILNAPHTATFLRDLKHCPAQQAASAYMNDLRATGAEEALSAHEYAGLVALIERFGAGGTLSPGLVDRLRAHWDEPVATHHACHPLTGPLNYYRASPLTPPVAPGTQPETSALERLQLSDDSVRVSVPTTVLWGEADTALLPGLLNGLNQHVPDLHVQRLPGVGHWVVHEAPQAVCDALQGLLRR
jgi:pimeloyl-ACP methyl ester carboxylesterase